MKHYLPLAAGLVLVGALVLFRTANPGAGVAPPHVVAAAGEPKSPEIPVAPPPNKVATAGNRTLVRQLVNSAIAAGVKGETRARQAAVEALRKDPEGAQSVIREEMAKRRDPNEIRRLDALCQEVAR